MVPAGPKVVVDCVVVLTEAQVIIGACSDKFLRFWDLTTHRVLCSCCYYHRLNADPTAGWHCGDVRPSDGSPQCSDAPVDEVLRHLAASDSEDLLVGEQPRARTVFHRVSHVFSTQEPTTTA